MAAARSSWADLQPELLGLVLRRLPSLADRVCLAAVCRPWRRSARLLEPTLPPPFPWLTLPDCTFLSIPDGKIYRLLPSPPPLPGHSRCPCSVGNWLFLQRHTGDGGSALLLSLVNPFTMDVVPLPDADTIYRGPCMLPKLVLLSESMSTDPLFALVITGLCRFESVISICQPSAASAFQLPDRERLCDIALVDGKLYAVSGTKLFVLEVESSSSSRLCCKPKIPSMKCIADDLIHQTGLANEKRICECLSYLVESSGRLLHVLRLVGGLSLSPGGDPTKYCRTFTFAVFEVDLTTSSSSSVRWRRLDSLQGQALFLGPCSRVLHASECGAQPDCIYFMCDYGSDDRPADTLRDSGVFNMTNGTITPLLPETMIMQMPQGIAKGHSTDRFYSARASWFFPY